MSSESSPQFLTEDCQSYCLRVADGTHESPKEVTVGKLLVTSKNIKEGRVVLDTAYRISETDFDEINKRSKVDQWDIILTMIGTVGELCLIEFQNPDFAIKNVGLLKCGDKYKAKWLYYFLKSSTGRALIEQRKKGSTQQYISLGEIRKLPISYPADPALLRGITDLLSTLDDRIALLRETNATLEAIAQALFKSWFVDFDPVHSKARGEQPEGMSEELAALFPDEFEESPLGMVPRGWSWRTMDDVSIVGIGKTPPRKEPQWFSESPADVPWVSIKDMGQAGTYINQTREFLTREAVDRFNVRVVPDNTVLLSFKLTVGRLSITTGWMVTNEAIAHFKLESDSPLSSEFIYLSLKNFDFSSLSSTSSIADAVNSKTVKSLPILVPPRGMVAAFHEQVAPLFARIRLIEHQAQTLATLRDTLLPRLISGQLRLPEAEAMVATARE